MIMDQVRNQRQSENRNLRKTGNNGFDRVSLAITLDIALLYELLSAVDSWFVFHYDVFDFTIMAAAVGRICGARLLKNNGIVAPQVPTA